MRNTATPAWTLIIVPPTPTASTRRVGVKMRTLRIFAMFVIAIASVSWTWVTAASETAEQMADRLAEEQRLTAALDDTLQSLRTAALAAETAKLPPVGMIMPVNGEITSRFSRSRFHPILQIFRAHRGVDLAAPAGTRIVAPAPGRVASVGRRLGYGLVIELVHSGGVVTRYAHCRSAFVQRGDTVTIGQAIGTVGASGLATAPHLHFEVWLRGTAVDPIRFIASTHLAPAATAAH
ncbi:MAG TPA: M23 family metallopeptidase [Gemmatimonadaceae bacterium]|nr:M23 family metallopeptidase [Gemmatimonadaceae bacterium]